MGIVFRVFELIIKFYHYWKRYNILSWIKKIGQLLIIKSIVEISYKNSFKIYWGSEILLLDSNKSPKIFAILLWMRGTIAKPFRWLIVNHIIDNKVRVLYCQKVVSYSGCGGECPHSHLSCRKLNQLLHIPKY